MAQGIVSFSMWLCNERSVDSMAAREGVAMRGEPSDVRNECSGSK
jgi:hypothetical protein